MKHNCVLFLLSVAIVLEFTASPAIAGNHVPVYSQTKSAVQALCGDMEGALQTQQEFVETCPVISQVTSAVHAVAGNTDKASEVQVKFGNRMLDVVDQTPIVGHIKGGIHYAVGDHEGGARALIAATKGVAVIGAGVLGGPGAAVAAGVGYDAMAAGIDAAVNGKRFSEGNGLVCVINRQVEEGRFDPGACFDEAAGIWVDGLVGGGKGVKGKANRINNYKHLYRKDDDGIPENVTPFFKAWRDYVFTVMPRKMPYINEDGNFHIYTVLDIPGHIPVSEKMIEIDSTEQANEFDEDMVLAMHAKRRSTLLDTLQEFIDNYDVNGENEISLEEFKHYVYPWLHMFNYACIGEHDKLADLASMLMNTDSEVDVRQAQALLRHAREVLEASGEVQE